jgi:hypothetical protein
MKKTVQALLTEGQSQLDYHHPTNHYSRPILSKKNTTTPSKTKKKLRKDLALSR